MPKRADPVAPSLPLDVAADATPVADDAVARFEQEMQELESIVSQMEKGELRLEDSLRLFERGTQLARSCRRSLDTAELKVRTLLGDDANADADTP
ncbi:MAG: xseB [Panacagrimonas sp.]|jgi:exodeoxyribonuclease VII small subunit|nr:exodeoxyribonuclease VII small subunit [Panacagrimonas sp.]MCC2656128.1 xseB [Panacagrimonas sp.]